MKRVLLGSLMLLAAACASSPPPPTDALVSAESAVRAAHEVGAEGVPQAQLHQQLAQEQITRARRLIDAGHTWRAERLLQRAKADAELSVALAREAQARAHSPQSSLERQRGLGPRVAADVE